MKTYSTKASEIRRTWHVLDASGIPLGRLASHAAMLIRGKHKVTYAPHLDTGDFVVIVNASQVALTGRKMEQKRYYRHSQYPGGLKVRSVREVEAKSPIRVVEHAVFGMLPHNSLGRSIHGHLKVYPGPDHPHAAQVNGPAQPALSMPPPAGRRRAAARARVRAGAVVEAPTTAPTALSASGTIEAATAAAVPEEAEASVVDSGSGPETQEAAISEETSE